ncbi:MAG: hypothetical protein R3C56_14595 [Pirellulaceae bacterium]
MMAYEDCWFQLVDLPPIAVDHVSLTTIELVRTSDLVLLVVDLSSDDLVDETAIVLETFANSKTRLGRHAARRKRHWGQHYPHVNSAQQNRL